MLNHSNQQKNVLVLFILVFSSIALTVVLDNQVLVRNENSTTNSSTTPITRSTTGINTQIPLSNYFHSWNNPAFIKNIGQLGTNTIQYFVKTSNLQIDFLTSKIQFTQVQSSTGNIVTYSISLRGSNTVNPVASNKVTGTTNYFVGTEHFTNVHSYKDIYYYNIYNGVDLHYYFTSQGLKYDFIVHPGANPDQISLMSSINTFFTISGSNLLINSKESGKVLLQDANLFVYQQSTTKTSEISASYTMDKTENNVVLYSIGSYDLSKDLIIDPVLVVNASTYLGGNNTDSGIDVVLDSQNNIYIAGQVNSLDFPTLNQLPNSTHSSLDNTTIFVMKLNSTGTGILWSTYYGGSGNDLVSNIRLDGSNNVVLIGSTDSVDFPITSGSQNKKLNGTQDAFIVVLSNDGSTIILSSLIGGSGSDTANGLYIPQGTENYYITGSTNSANFTTALQWYNSTYAGYGTDDAFFIKTNETGIINYATYIGGNKSDEGVDIGVDSFNNTFVMGSTSSNLTGNILNGVFADIFITKFSNTGILTASRLIGGNMSDIPTSLAINDNNIYITGSTYSKDFPVNTTAYDKTYESQDAFVLKLNNSLAITYSTLFGNASMYPNKIVVSSTGQATIAGFTTDMYLPLKDEYRTNLDGTDGFITTFNNLGTDITYSTYFGGNSVDKINSFVLGSNNDLYLVGETTSTNFPVYQAIQPSTASLTQTDAFFTKLSKDYIAPTLSIKPDFEYHQGTTGNKLTFLASDNDPEASYMIYKNSSLVHTGLLQPEKVSYSVDGLALGIYNFTVLVKDRSGNYVEKTTFVTVLEPLTSTTTTTSTNSTAFPSTTSNNGSNNQLDQYIVIIIILAIISAIASSLLVRNRMNKDNGQETKGREPPKTEIVEETTKGTDSVDALKNNQEIKEENEKQTTNDSVSGNNGTSSDNSE